MNEIIRIIETLIKDGINWQETIVICSIFTTLGFIVWALTVGLVTISKCLIGAIDNITTSVIKRTKEATNSFLK